MTVVVIVGTEADVQPAATASVMLQDELIEVQMVDHPVVPLAPRVQVGDMDVGGTTIEVLRVAYAMYRLVQCFATIATIDMDGMAYMVAQRLQHLAAELTQVYHHLPRLRCVVNTQTACRLTLYEFAQLEVCCELSIWIIILHILCVYLNG